MEMEWTLCITLVVLLVPCESENVTFVSTNGYLYVKESYNLSATCQISKKGIFTFMKFFPSNKTSSNNQPIILGANRTSNFCASPPYTTQCNFTSNMFTITVPPDKYYNGQTWMCDCKVDNVFIGVTNTTTVVEIVPVRNISITSNMYNNAVDVVEGENQTFTCTTGTSRPAAWIQWYIGDRNVTNQATSQVLPVADDKFITSSTLLYVGEDADHNKSLHCAAVNFDTELKSTEVYIFVPVPVNNVTILSTGSNVVEVVEGENQTFTCITGTSRPAAWIQWYIGDRNVTNQAKAQLPQTVGDKFISSSTLLYIGNDTDHNKYLHCVAVNFKQEWVMINSSTVTIFIKVPVKKVTITSAENNTVVDVVERENQTCTCTTGLSRPAAWIQWYIGGRNVTNQAAPQLPQPNGDKFVSSSTLIYVGNDTDHNNSLYCEAGNTDGGQKVRSLMKIVFIKVPVTKVTITSADNNNVVDVVEGENQTFTCTTGLSRPAAWIQWYIGGRNVTNQATPQLPQLDGDKFVSSSTLIYVGNDTDHNNSLYCEAVNIDGGKTSTSMKLHMQVKVPVKKVVIITNGNNIVVHVLEGEYQSFNCTTGPSRPAAWIQWYIGGRNVTNQAIAQQPQPDRDKFISSSSLVYTGNDSDHNSSLYCNALNIVGQQAVYSTQKSIFIQVKPKNLKLEPPQRNYTIREEQLIGGINCTASCRPECKYYWRGPNSFMQNKSNLMLGSIYRNESGSYTCCGTNDFGSISSYGVNIEVYYPPSITDLKIHSNTTVTEGSAAIFQCVIESNPKSNVEWKFLRTGKVLQIDLAVLESYFTINKTECAHTGVYECQATNIIGHLQEMSTKIIRFSVLCSVRIDISHESTSSTIGLKNEDSLNITTYLISVPPPVISWTFYSNMTGNTSALNSTDVFGDYVHVSNLQKFNISQADFGVYTLTAYNNVSKEYTRSFTVIPQRKPTPPSNLSVSCDKMSLKVVWKSEFNGGDKQTFRIIWWDNILYKETYGSNIPDSGKDNYHEDTINNLQPGSLYFLKLEAKNHYGTTFSNENLNCTTEGSTIEDSNATLLGAVIGSAGGLVVILLIVGVSFIIRRRIEKGTDDNGRTHLTTLKTEEEDEDGMKDNVLYQSAGPNFEDQQKGDNGNQYALVQKKRSQLNDNNVQETALYSEVKEKPNKKPRDDVYSNVKNAKTKVNGKKLKPSDDVYQNMDIAVNGSPIIVSKDNKNKDGLQYADLVFNPLPNGSKFVIRGIEDRTIYATVDTTQNIDPLPDSDDEDIGKNYELEQRDNGIE